MILSNLLFGRTSGYERGNQRERVRVRAITKRSRFPDIMKRTIMDVIITCLYFYIKLCALSETRETVNRLLVWIK